MGGLVAETVIRHRVAPLEQEFHNIWLPQFGLDGMTCAKISKLSMAFLNLSVHYWSWALIDPPFTDNIIACPN